MGVQSGDDEALTPAWPRSSKGHCICNQSLLGQGNTYSGGSKRYVFGGLSFGFPQPERDKCEQSDLLYHQRLLALEQELAQRKRTPSMQLLAQQRIPRLEEAIKHLIASLTVSA